MNARAESFIRHFVGTVIVGAIGKPVIGALVAFATWTAPTDWLGFFGLTLESVRFLVAIALGWAMFQQINFKGGAK